MSLRVNQQLPCPSCGAGAPTNGPWAVTRTDDLTRTFCATCIDRRTIDVDQRTVLPLLKRPGWQPEGLAWSLLSRPLAGAAASPSIYYGWDHPATFFMVGDHDLVEGTIDELHRAAISNLAGINPGDWEAVPSLGVLPRMLGYEQEFLAAERILDVEFLRRAQTELRTSTLMAGIPHRGALSVWRPTRDPEILDEVRRFLRQRRDSGVDEPISDELFLIEDGRLIGHASAHDAPVSTDERLPLTLSPTTSLDEHGRHRLVFTSRGTSSLEDLERAIARTVEHGLGTWLEDPSFSGSVVFDIVVPAGEQRRYDRVLGGLGRTLADEVRALRTRTGTHVEVTVQLDG